MWSVPSGTPLIEVVIIALYALICGAEGWEDMEAYGQIPPGPRGCGYAKAEVEVRQLLDGCWRIYQGNKLLGEYPPTEVVEPLRRRKRNPSAPGADDTQWIYLASACKYGWLRTPVLLCATVAFVTDRRPPEMVCLGGRRQR